MNNNSWPQNVFIADADYADRVAFDLTVNFERMLERRVPPADLARWLECIALDGAVPPASPSPSTVPSGSPAGASPSTAPSGSPAGASPAPTAPSGSPAGTATGTAQPLPAPVGEGQGVGSVTSVILLHEAASPTLRNFVPAHYADDLHGRAFQSRLGEFTITCVPTTDLADKPRLLADTLSLVTGQPEVQRLMLVADDAHAASLIPLLRRHDSEHPASERRVTLFTMQPVTGGSFRHELLGYSLMAALGITSAEIDSKLHHQSL